MSMVPTEITTEIFHEISDTYLDKLVGELEALQEEREDVDVELTVRFLSTFSNP